MHVLVALDEHCVEDAVIGHLVVDYLGLVAVIVLDVVVVDHHLVMVVGVLVVEDPVLKELFMI